MKEYKFTCGRGPYCDITIQQGWYICKLHGTWIAPIEEITNGL